MNMTLEEDIAADVTEMSINVDFLEKNDDNAPVTMNLSEIAPHGSKLTGIPVKQIDLGDVAKGGASINYVTVAHLSPYSTMTLFPSFLRQGTQTHESNMY